MKKSYPVAIVASHEKERVLPAAWGLAAFACALQAYRPGRIEIVLLGEEADIGPAAEVIAAGSGLDVRAVLCSGLRAYSFDAYHHILEDAFKNEALSYILAPHDSRGMDYAPALAASLGTACITGVDGLALKGEEPCFQKDLFGGKVKAEITSRRDTTVITFQPGAFRQAIGGRFAPGAGWVALSTAE